jgi:putative membrane protein
MMVQQHAQSNNELIALMSSRGVSPPQGLAADKATKLHKLAALPRSDAFDNGYIRVVGIEDHRAAIRELEKARQSTRDAALRAWIDRSLAMMRDHLKAAEAVAGQLAG